MKTRFALLAALLAITALALAPAASAQVHSGGFIPVAPQTLSIPLSSGTVTGTLNGIKITNITSNGSGLVASGLATVTTSTGTIIGSFTNAPLDPSGSCPILHLTIGPINLNLLGLQVTTNQIVLDITAQSGPGNLLGNLLCDVANLLNHSPAPLTQIAGLLQQILSLL